MDLDRPPDIVVVAGGEPVAPGLVAAVPGTARIVAADAGVDLARSLGWEVHVAVGDFDSVSAEGRSALADEGADVRVHPMAKDATDLELALEVAAELAPARPAPGHRVLVIGLEGGRPDHALANLLLAAAEPFAALDIELVLAQGRAWVVRDHLTGSLPAGGLVSLVPVHGPATVSVSGVRWPLDRAALAAGTTRGVSNEAVGGPFELRVHAGAVLCITPRTEETP
ncbi:MAG TPA: thiamine diphosphokinase [Acidimicrobiales bacterium]|nr:thiamine diphosphokinase [Acidimicrobiales bacterium]